MQASTFDKDMKITNSYKLFRYVKWKKRKKQKQKSTIVGIRSTYINKKKVLFYKI